MESKSFTKLLSSLIKYKIEDTNKYKHQCKRRNSTRIIKEVNLGKLINLIENL